MTDINSNMKNPQCPYCGYESELVKGDKIYPHRPDLHHKNFYLCGADNAYVGCHGDTTVPLGRLADPHLRKMKSFAHREFDPLWKSGKMSRHAAYKLLAERMKIDGSLCHIGMFSPAQCGQVVDICRVIKKELGI